MDEVDEMGEWMSPPLRRDGVNLPVSVKSCNAYVSGNSIVIKHLGGVGGAF